MRRANRAAAPNRPFRGFTLVELLVSVALTLFLLALFATLMQFATTGVREAKGINAIDAKLRNAVTAIKIDLNQIYLAHDATLLSPGGLFTSPTNIPTRGYFSIEENSRALTVGLDLHGNPVELDYDDVLSFTARRSGATRADIFTGRAGIGSGMTANVNGRPVDLGTFLDTFWKAPASRQDNPSNGLTTSHYAEIVYFARHNGAPPTLAELGADPYVLADATGVQALPALPRTMTLHRRQLLVLDDDALNRPRSNANGNGPVLIPASPPGGSIYNYVDVSVSRELVRTGTALALATGGSGGTQNAVHFNTLSDLTRREFRYGMQPVFVGAFPAPFDTPRYANVPTTTNPEYLLGRTAMLSTNTLRAYPLSHVSLPGAANAYSFGNSTGGVAQPQVHEYAANAPLADRATRAETWLGRPTWAESAHAAYPWWNPATAPGAAPAPTLTLDASGRLAAYVSAAAGGGGEDVLIRDVVSFDIKVLEIIAGYPGALATGGTGTDFFGDRDTPAPQGPPPYSQTQDHKADVAPYNAPAGLAVGTRFNNIYQRRQAFVDPGYGADQLDVNVPPGGDVQGAAAERVNTTDVSNYLASLPAGPAANLQLNDAAFGFAWSGAPAKPAAISSNNLGYGAFGQLAAPFGVPLTLPEGTTGAGPDYTQGPDGGGAVADNLVDYPNAPTALRRRPGLFGPDNWPGTRGVGPATSDISLSSDDNPFVSVPFKLSGQVGGNAATAATTALFHPFNLQNLNPRNTYDSWSAHALGGATDPDAVPARGALRNRYAQTVTLPEYNPSPVLVVPDGGGSTYIPNPNFRPVPYPRPLKGIQIKLRVLERRTGIVREATVRHYFPTTPTP